LWDCSVINAGIGLTKLLRYNFAKHLVFSLLKGRPVIIFGTPQNENAVKELVTTCTLFIPGSGRGVKDLVSYWRTKPIHMSDLAYLKLVGLSKRVTIPKAVERYVTVLDYENGQLRCPPYNKGHLIDKILGLRLHWPDEKTHLAYVHFKLLEVATQACLYYQMCCVSSNPVYLPTSAVSGPILRRISSPIYPSSEGNTGREKAKSKDDSGTVENGRSDAPAEITDDVDEKKKFKQTETMAGYPTTRPERSSSLYGGGKALSNNRSHFSEGQLPITVPPVPNSVREQARNNFFRQIKLKPHDIAIIEYFAEVVKEQQSLEMHGPGAEVAPVIHLDYSPCVLFKNTTKEKGKGGKM